jgi:predicted site-specific integrase-resolvase
MSKDKKLNVIEAADYLQISVTAVEEATFLGWIRYIELEDGIVCYRQEQLEEYKSKLAKR